MTRAQFNLVADALKESKPKGSHYEGNDFESALLAWNEVAWNLARKFQSINPLFDPARFLKACGFED